MEEILKTTPQTEATVSDRDTGDSLFLTQFVSSANREVKRRCLSRKLAQSFSGESRDESESCKGEEIKKEPDALPLRDSDSDSSEPDLCAIRKAFSLPAPQDKTTSDYHVYRSKHAFPKRIKFPFLKSHSGKLTVNKSQVLVNAEIGGFFKTVKEISEEYKKRRRELSPSLVPAVVDSDDMEKESSEDDGSDIRNVDPDCFIVTGKKTKIQLWMTSGVIKKMKSSKDQEKSRKEQKNHKRNQPAKVAKGLAKGQDASNSSLSINVHQLRSRKQEKKNIKSAPSSTLSRTDCKVVRNLFADQEEHSEIEAEVLVRSSQSQTIDDCRPTKDGTRSWETLERDSDDETVILETQRPDLTCQSEEEPQTWGTDGDGELRNESGSFHKRLFEKPARQSDGTMVSSPLKKRQNNVGTVSKHASERHVEPLLSKFGISKSVEIHLVNCLAVQADNAITPEKRSKKKQQKKVEDKNVNMEPLETMRVVLDFEQDITEKEKTKQKTCDKEKHKHGSKSVGSEELQTTPLSSPRKKTVSPQGSSAVIHEEFDVGSSSSEEFINNEDFGDYSKRNTSSQDLFEKPGGQTDKTMVFSSLRKSKIANNDEKHLLRRSNTSFCHRTTESTESLKENIGGERQHNYRPVTQHASENLVKSLRSKYGILSREEIRLVNCLAPQTNNSITPEKKEKKKQQEQAEGENVNMESCHVEIMETTGTPMMNWDSEQEKTEKKRQKKKEKNTSSVKEKQHDCGSKSAGSKELQTFLSSKKKMVSTQGSSTIIHKMIGVGGPVINEDFSVPSKSYTSLHLFEELKDLSDLSSCSSSFKESDKEDAQESTMDYDDSIEENKKNCSSKFLNEETDNAEYSQQSSECGAPEQSETSTVQQARKKKRKKKADVSVALSSVKYPLGSNISNESSPNKGILMTVQGQETRMEAVDSPLFYCGGLKFLRRKNRKKAKATEVCPGQDPAFIHEGHQERFMPSEDVSEPEKRKKDKGKDNEKNDNGCFSEEPADSHLVDPVLVVQHSDARLAEACGAKGKKKRKKDKQTLTERKSQDEDTQIFCVSAERLLPIADEPQKHTRTAPSGQQDNGTEIHSKTSKYLILSDGSEPVKKKKARNRHASDDMDPLQCTEESESRYDAIENMVVERQRKKIITSGPPYEKRTEPLKGSCNIPSSIEFQPVMSQSLWAGHLSEMQSSENCRIKVKKKDKHKKSSSLTIKAGQDEDTQMVCPDNVCSVSITGNDQSIPALLSFWLERSDIHGQESSKDLVSSNGSKPLKKKKAKKKDNPDDKLMFHYAEQSKSGYGRTETNNGESGGRKKRKRDQKEEMSSESLVSTAAGPEQLTRTGLFIQQESSTKFHRETSNDVIQSDDSKPVKKKRRHLFNDAITSQDAEQTKSGCGITESSTGERRGKEIITATRPSFENLTEPLTSNWYIPSSGEIQPAQTLQANQHSEAQSTEGCEVNIKKKKKDKHRKSSLSIWTGQKEDTQVPCLSSECLVSIAEPRQLTRIDSSSQQDSSTEVHSQVSSQDFFSSDACESIKRKKKKKKYPSGDMVPSRYAEQFKTGYGTTGTNTGEKQEEELLSEGLASIADGPGQLMKTVLFSHQDSSTNVHRKAISDVIQSDGSEPVKKKKAKKRQFFDDIVTSQDAEQSKSGCETTESSIGEKQGGALQTGQHSASRFIEHCEEKEKKKKKGKHKKYEEYIWRGQNEDTQVPCPSSECLVSIAEPGHLTRTDSSGQRDSSTEVHSQVSSQDLISSDACESAKKKKKKKDISDDMVPSRYAEQFKTGYGTTGERQEEEMLWEGLASIADGPGQLVLFSHQDSSTNVHRKDISDVILSDGSEPVKKKKAKKRQLFDDIVTSQDAEQTKSECETTESSTGEKQGEALQTGQHSASRFTEHCEEKGKKKKKKKKKDKHKESSLTIKASQNEDPQLPSQSFECCSSIAAVHNQLINVYRMPRKDLKLSAGSELVKKKKTKKKDNADDIANSQDAEQTKSGRGITESSTGERRGKEIITATRPSFENLTEQLKSNWYIPSSGEIQPVMCQALQAESKITEHCEEKKKDKNKKSSLTLWTSQNEDTQMPSPSPEGFVSVATPGQLTRIESSSQQDSSTEVNSQVLSQDLISSDACESVKRKRKKEKKKKKDTSDDMVPLCYAEQTKSGCGITESSTGERRGKEIITATRPSFENLTEPLMSNWYIPSNREIQPVIGQALQAGQHSEAQSTEDCEVNVKKKKKKKKDKHRKSSLSIWTGQNEDTQVPSPSSERLVSIAEPRHLTRIDSSSQQDSSTEVHSQVSSQDLISSDACESVKRKRKKKKDTSDDVVPLCYAEQTKSGCGITESSTGERQGKEIITATRPSFENLTEPLMSNWYIPSNREIQPVIGQALQAGQHSEAQSTEDCEVNVKKKKKKKKDKHTKSSLSLWTGQNEDTQVPSPSSERLVSIAEPRHLTRIDSSSQQDTSTEVHSQVSSQDLISSDACESIKKKKKKKKDPSDDMVPSHYAEQFKTGYGTTGTNTGEKQEEELLSEGLASIADGPGQLVKTVLFSHQDSSTNVHRKAISDVILSDGSEPVKKKKAKKRQLSQFKSGCGTTESSTGKHPVEEMITATGPSFENLKESLKSKWFIH